MPELMFSSNFCPEKTAGASLWKVKKKKKMIIEWLTHDWREINHNEYNTRLLTPNLGLYLPFYWRVNTEQTIITR